MRKSLKRLKELDNLLESEELQKREEKKKTRRRKKEIERQPNILGGGFVVVSLIILFLIIQVNAPDTKVAGEATKNSDKSQQETVEAKKRVTSELQHYVQGVQDKVNNFSVLGAFESKQVEKLSNDVDSLQEVPKKAAEGAKNEVMTTTIGEIVDSVIRLRKIGEDAERLKDVAFEKLGEL